MIIVGGTYQETVVNPTSDDLMGSGMRAAAALALRADRPTLVTALDARTQEEASYVAEALGVALAPPMTRSEPVGFRYSTPLSTPAVNGPSSRLTSLTDGRIRDETVLVYGLLEDVENAVAGSVSASTLVIDPQRPRDAEPYPFDSLAADRIFVVANANETRRLGGAQNILERFPTVQGVIVKRGANGCAVSQRSASGVTTELIGAHPTTRVWPIGSGDTFSAGVAHALDEGKDLVEAARIGSAAAAHWCSTRSPAVPSAVLNGDFAGLPVAVAPASGLVYLAGPFFTVAERWLVDTVKDALEHIGLEVWSPVHEVGPGGLEVAEADLAGLGRADAVLALLDHADPGTVFEVGWAVRERVPVVGFATSLDPEGAKMMAGTAVELHRDLSTACYRAAWAALGLRPSPGWANV